MRDDIWLMIAVAIALAAGVYFAMRNARGPRPNRKDRSSSDGGSVAAATYGDGKKDGDTDGGPSDSGGGDSGGGDGGGGGGDSGGGGGGD